MASDPRLEAGVPVTFGVFFQSNPEGETIPQFVAPIPLQAEATSWAADRVSPTSGLAVGCNKAFIRILIATPVASTSANW
jgi:hypothetical protein